MTLEKFVPSAKLKILGTQMQKMVRDQKVPASILKRLQLLKGYSQTIYSNLFIKIDIENSD